MHCIINRVALNRIFSNLIENAIKYSDGDFFVELNGKGEVTVSNIASKLSAIEANKLFDRFYTVESAKKSTGLGLSIVKVLVEQAGGTINAKYTAGRLMFCVCLPFTD